MPDIESVDMGLVWVALLGLLIVYKLIDILAAKGMELWDHRHGNGVQGVLKENTAALKEVRDALASLEDPPPYPQCHYDPLHYERIKDLHVWVAEIRQMQEVQKLDIAGGRFECKVTEEHLRMIEKENRA